MPIIQESQGRFSITIPTDYIIQAGLEKGAHVTISFNERGNLEIKKLK